MGIGSEHVISMTEAGAVWRNGVRDDGFALFGAEYAKFSREQEFRRKRPTNYIEQQDDTEFKSKDQLKGSIALPKVGITYSDGKGGVKNFGVSDASELGSLDAAFGAAAAGVRDRNLELAKSLQPGPTLKPLHGSAIVISNGEISLKGERESESRKRKAFFGTDKSGNKGWHTMSAIDSPRKGVLVGKTLNVDASADSGKHEPSSEVEEPWSYEVSRTAFKRDEETGEINLYNYFKTIYVSGMGRTIGQSEEREVLVGKFGSSAQFCAKPVIDSSTGKITHVQFGTDVQLAAGQPTAVLDLSGIGGGKYSVKPEYANGILSSLRFGTEKQIDEQTQASIVFTQVGCPYQS